MKYSHNIFTAELKTVLLLCQKKTNGAKQAVKSYFKGTVSRELRHRLLYIIQKLFSRPIVTSLKILILLKGQFAMYIKQFSVSLAGSYYFV